MECSERRRFQLGRPEGRPLPTYQGRPVAEPTKDITGRLARYMMEARDRNLPPAVVIEAKHRILDTFSAMVSGAKLKPGEMAIQYARAQGGVAEASVVTANFQTSAINAALANGMCAHADETDDFEPETKAHPGCSVVPAALAMAERDGRSGTEFLRAVTLGYDVCCRFLLALGPDLVRATHRSAEGTSATFGSRRRGRLAGAARRARHALRDLVCRAAGVGPVELGRRHRTRREGVRLRRHGREKRRHRGDDGANGIQRRAGRARRRAQHARRRCRPIRSREAMVAGLGRASSSRRRRSKCFRSAYPIQSALDAFLALRREHALTADNVEHIRVRLPEDGARIVDNSAMPDVNCQYIIAVALVDGTVSFDASHSQERMKDPQIRAVKSRVELVADRSLMVPDAPRSALVEVTLADGRTVNSFHAPSAGIKENPLTTEAVNEKARSLMMPVIGAQRTRRLIARVNALENVADMREFRLLI